MHHIPNINKELDLVRKYFKPLSLDSKFALELQDDVAYLESNGRIIISTDSIVEGIHLPIGVEPKYLAHKLLARNLSDIAAKGGKPIAYTLAIIMPKCVDENDISDFASGLGLLTNQYGCPLIGGDISKSETDIMIANITIYGEVTDCVPLRKNAKVGDAIYVTGQIGRAFLGFNGEEKFRDFYFVPLPKIESGQKIAQLANAMMDISDGLFQDLQRILISSSVGAEVDFERIPFPDLASCKKAYNLTNLITFGDDYELLFTSSNHNIQHDVATKIGIITPDNDLKILNAPKNLDIQNLGFSHL